MSLADTIGTKKRLFGQVKRHAGAMQRKDLQARYGKKPPSDDSEPVPGAEEEPGDGETAPEDTPEAIEEAPAEPLGELEDMAAADAAPEAGEGDNPAVAALASIDAEQLKAALLKLLAAPPEAPDAVPLAEE